MAIKKALDMVARAKSEIENLSVEQVKQEMAGGKAIVVDIRDQEERVKNGAVPGSQHVSRGMLEFVADPSLPVYKDFFQPDQRIILHCAVGGRSALGAKALKEMGYTNVAHLDVGFNGWKAAGAPIEQVS
jgi:rhodanese-related sulfurtransferase